MHRHKPQDVRLIAESSGHPTRQIGNIVRDLRVGKEQNELVRQAMCFDPGDLLLNEGLNARKSATTSGHTLAIARTLSRHWLS